MTNRETGMRLSPRQLQALTAAATGATLRQIGDQLGITREHVSVLLSGAYRRLDVNHLPRDQKRAAAVRAAVRRGIIPAPVPAAAEATDTTND